MLKALKAYSLHRSSDEGKRTPRRSGTGHGESVADEAKSSRFRSQPDTAHCFKLSQCRLRFHDDVDADGSLASVPSGKGPLLSIKRRPLLSSPSPRVMPVPTLYSLEESDGLLVDAVGHVFRGNRVRPWTPVPMKLSEYFKMNKDKLQQVDPLRYSEVQPPVRSSFSAEQASRRRSVPGTHPSVRFAPTNMSDIPRSKTFQRRNRTTHLWTDGSQLMSQSLPTSSFLHQRYGGSSSSSSPRSSRDTASEKTSPAASKPNSSRPSSSYSYDGGFFLGAHTGQAEYFVIHPDWVSEAVTIKKLSLGNKSFPAPQPPPVSKSANFKSGSWTGRRCLSAPPAKRRNPITWDTVDSIDIVLINKSIFKLHISEENKNLSYQISEFIICSTLAVDLASIWLQMLQILKMNGSFINLKKNNLVVSV
ncbi:hypothetical protein Btru_003705 [Bulinus truncatus]|nr:hypothetical protein Btru_003705 [Bulinus truncatus]